MNQGAGSRIRTDDLLITNQLLYQLSYAGKKAAHINARRRLKQVADHFVVVVTAQCTRRMFDWPS